MPTNTFWLMCSSADRDDRNVAAAGVNRGNDNPNKWHTSDNERELWLAEAQEPHDGRLLGVGLKYGVM
jgi:hypothetical protein